MLTNLYSIQDLFPSFRLNKISDFIDESIATKTFNTKTTEQLEEFISKFLRISEQHVSWDFKFPHLASIQIHKFNEKSFTKTPSEFKSLQNKNSNLPFFIKSSEIEFSRKHPSRTSLFVPTSERTSSIQMSTGELNILENSLKMYNRGFV